MFGIKIASYGKKEKNITISKEAKFGVSFSVWDGEELLERAVECIRPVADYINIVWSDKSWYGVKGNKDVEKICNSLKKRGLVDEVIKYETTSIKKDDKDRLNKKRIEQTKKRNLGLNAAVESGCNYFMTMDTDEFYDKDALISAKNKIKNNPIWTHTFVHILNYGKDPTKRYDGRKWEYFVPFFAKVNKESKLGVNTEIPCMVDPTRCVLSDNNSNYRVLEDIFMHHFTRVRRKLDDKYKNRVVSADIDKDWINKEEKFINVPDTFGLKNI